MSKYTGLSEHDVRSRKKRGEVNGNFNLKTKSVGQILFTNIFTLFNLVNVFMAVCLILVHSYKNMMFLGVVFWNIVIGIVQEIRSKRVIDRLSLLSAPGATIIREGKEKRISNEDIVIDDILVLKGGNQVSVDSIILEGNCEVNESLLTGETDLVFKKPGEEILSGSFIVSGNVIARAIHVGKENYVNKITSQAKYLKRPNSEILKSVKFIIKGVSITILPIGILLFFNQLETQNFDKAVVGAIAGVLGMIPSGMVLLTSVVLAVSVAKLGKKNTLVQEMYCIETLARVNMLCLDKTGTITEGTLSVEELIPLTGTMEEFETVLAAFVGDMDDENITYDALERYVRENKLIRVENKIIKEKMRFSSERKMSRIIYEDGQGLVLGAMEFIIEKPDEKLSEYVKKYSEQGMRVLVLAEFSEGETPDQNITNPKGIIVLSDIIREDAKETFEYFKRQGVKLKVISGDNPVTVSRVAKRAGIDDADNFIDATRIITGEDITEVAEKYTVFGRVTPSQKYELIKAMKCNGYTVAMTGDGVNDVMALKEADCSIAMQSGSDAARNVSQIVLMDSDFSNMPRVVEEGRKTINNLERSASLYLTKTMYSILIALLFMILPSAFPFVPVQMTFVGSLTIGIPSFVLALEPNTDMVKGRFIVNVLKKAFPGAALVFTNILLMQLYSMMFDTNALETSTMNLYGLAIAALMQLVKCCKPFDRIRSCLCIVLIILFEIGVLFFKGLLDLTYLGVVEYVYVGIVFAVSAPMYRFFGKVIEKFCVT